MLLKSLKLENIRSYESQVMDFSKGSVLLSGEIGSGKSTILHAIEFALFGIKQGELTGAHMLRHGAKKGTCELTFSVDNITYTIKRVLKRTPDRIGQTAGYLIKDGLKEDLTPRELRARVFDILNYPKAFLSKSDDLLYRFTVYTPQEHMKRIIFEPKEERLNTLRKVFNIDKYKTMKENSLIFVKGLKDRQSTLKGQISDLEQKKAQSKELSMRISGEKETTELLKTALLNAQNKKHEDKKSLDDCEKNAKIAQGIKKSISLDELSLKRSKTEFEKISIDIDSQKKSIFSDEAELKDKGSETNLDDLSRRNEALQAKFEQELKEKSKRSSFLEAKLSHIIDQTAHITKLDSCPTCKQEVSKEYKEEFISKTALSKARIKEEKENIEREKEILEKKLKTIKHAVLELIKRKSEQQLIKKKLQMIGDRKKTIELWNKRKIDLSNEIKALVTQLTEKRKSLDAFSEIEKQHIMAKEAYERSSSNERTAAIKYNEKNRVLELLLQNYEDLKQEISKKEESKKKT